MVDLCSWCGHLEHAGRCPQLVTLGVLVGRLLPRRLGSEGDRRPCLCARAG